MGFFKKPVAQVDNDDEIRREIRARVAKQAGIYDEEYIQTGKIGGNKNAADRGDAVAASHVSAAAIPIISENAKGETELYFEPNKVEPTTVKTVPEQGASKKSGKEKKPPKEKKQKPSKKDTSASYSQKPKKKKRNVAMILFILVLLLAFIPLYYYLTGGGNHVPEMTASSQDNTLLLAEPLVVQGMVADPDDEEGIKVYYSLDNGSASLIYTFDSVSGPFEYEIDLPDTVDFVGEHSVSVYAKDQKGELSESVVLKFTVTKPALTGLAITTPPTKVKYTVGNALDLTGLVVSASYEGGKTTPVTTYTSDIAIGTKLSQTGQIPVTVSYTEDNIIKTATFNVTVEKAAAVEPSRNVNNSYPVPSLEVYRAGPGSADLQWNALSGVSGYQIQRKASGGTWAVVNTISADYTSWTDNGPSSGRTYYYRMSSYKVVNGVKVYSPFSSTVSIGL